MPLFLRDNAIASIRHYDTLEQLSSRDLIDNGLKVLDAVIECMPNEVEMIWAARGEILVTWPYGPFPDAVVNLTFRPAENVDACDLTLTIGRPGQKHWVRLDEYSFASGYWPSEIDLAVETAPILLRWRRLLQRALKPARKSAKRRQHSMPPIARQIGLLLAHTFDDDFLHSFSNIRVFLPTGTKPLATFSGPSAQPRPPLLTDEALEILTSNCVYDLTLDTYRAEQRDEPVSPALQIGPHPIELGFDAETPKVIDVDIDNADRINILDKMRILRDFGDDIFHPHLLAQYHAWNMTRNHRTLKGPYSAEYDWSYSSSRSHQ